MKFNFLEFLTFYSKILENSKNRYSNNFFNFEITPSLFYWNLKNRKDPKANLLQIAVNWYCYNTYNFFKGRFILHTYKDPFSITISKFLHKFCWMKLFRLMNIYSSKIMFSYWVILLDYLCKLKCRVCILFIIRYGGGFILYHLLEFLLMKFNC